MTPPPVTDLLPVVGAHTRQAPEAHRAHAVSARAVIRACSTHPRTPPVSANAEDSSLFHDPARTSLTLADFLSYFPDVRTQGNGYVVNCAAHDDSDPSLRVAYSAERKTIALRCRTGCTTEDVMDALNLTMSALFDVEVGDLTESLRTADKSNAAITTGDRAALRHYLDRATAALEDSGGDALCYVALRFGVSESLALELGLGYDDGNLDGGRLRLSRSRFHDTARLVVPFYDFDGHAHGLQARALDDKATTVRWSGPVNPEGSSWGKYGVLRASDARPEILVTEGPGDGLTAVAVGYDAVSIRGAALSTSPALADRIAAGVNGRPVIVAGDNDAAGELFASTVSAALSTRAIDVRRLSLPSGVNDLAAWRHAEGDRFPAALAEAVSQAREVSEQGQPGGRREASYNPASTDDAHLGARIAEEHLRGRWAWSSGLGWLTWDGRRWENVPETAAQEAVRCALIDAHRHDLTVANTRLEARHDKARRDEDEEAAKAERDAAAAEHRDRLRALRSYFTLGKIKAVLSIAKGVLIEDAASFDAEPYLLNVGNGVVDLQTGDLRPHRPELRFTKITDVHYQPGRVHADWEAALQAMPEDVREWMRLRFGQAATGFPPSDDIVPFLYGGGANGKSTIVTGVLQALGDFAVVIPEKVLLTSPGDHPTEMMTLHGRRLTVLEELPQGRYLDAKRLKSIAGTDRITARLIGKDNISWTPTHALIVTTNYELRVDENDHGTWRRLARVPFPYRYGDAPGDLPKDPTLRPRVRDGRDGQHEAALAWIVSGAVDWHAAGEVLPKAPLTVEESTREWRGTADVLGRFLEEVTDLDEDAAVLSREFYDVFRAWSDAHGFKAWGDQLFWERLKGHDVMASGAIVRPSGTARLGGRKLSSAVGAAAPSGPARYVFGLRFTDEARGYVAGGRLLAG
ncbi:phage/plasmid primase, P4 family [Blastococcus sp. SYSU D01042]